MKKVCITLFTALMLLFVAYPVCAAQVTDTDNSVTIVFQANGGAGNMENQMVTIGTAAPLTANTFVREGFLFEGWNTKADGTGTAFADSASAAPLATIANKGKTITLYACWKLQAPKINSLKKSSPVTIKVKYSKIPQADGYEIQYSTKKNFKKAETIVAKKGSSSQELTNTIPGKTHFVRIRSFVKSGVLPKKSN